ncbi:MAG: hypothetical protein N2560_01405 [Ignavibacteria bacterium]|nr:hypothetical protein [Ignavibacteria bacterium]
MGKNIENKKYKEFAKEIVEILSRSLARLEYSFEKVSKFLLNKANFSEEELETIESFCSRFARANDILLQKAFRFLDIYEYKGYDFDVQKRISNARKRGLIQNEMEFKYIRELRNEIAHNYATDYYIELFKEVFKYTPKLVEISKRTIQYLQSNINN